MADLTLEQMRAEAFELFTQWAEPCCIPSIEGLELAILNRHLIAEIWTPNTMYWYGDLVQVYPRNGWLYTNVETGVSGATAPTWSLGFDSLTSDNTTSWVAVGQDYKNVYDVRSAVHEAWTIKASRASHLVTTSAGTSSVQASLLHEQCRARAKEFAPVS